jgi:hypothetical protein
MRCAFTENSSIATLQSNRQRTDEESLNRQWRGSSKLSVANTGRDTTDKLPETIPKGAG